MTPIRAFALADPNVAYPRDTMLDLERDGVIGRYAASAVSMTGSISQFDELATEVAPRIAEEFTAMGADLVLVVPFCPQCHVAFGILARSDRKAGSPDHQHHHALQARQLPEAASCLVPRLPAGVHGRKPATGESAAAGRSSRPRCSMPSRPGRTWELKRLPFQWAAGRQTGLGSPRRGRLPRRQRDPRLRPGECGGPRTGPGRRE